jgi:hypothetical protein
VKRFRRIFFDGMAIISAVLCVVTIGLWIAGNWYEIAYSCERGGCRIEIGASWGHISFIRFSPFEREQPWHIMATPRGTYPVMSTNLQPWFQWGRWWVTKSYLDFAGFTFASGIYGFDSLQPVVPPFWFVRIPEWFIALLMAILPAQWCGSWWISIRRARERLKRGLCRACGYDMRATPQKCPECGREAVKS